MTRKAEERRRRREILVARAEAQREELSQEVAALELPLRAADTGIALAQALRDHRRARVRATGRAQGLLHALRRALTTWRIVRILGLQIHALADRRRPGGTDPGCRPVRPALHAAGTRAGRPSPEALPPRHRRR